MNKLDKVIKSRLKGKYWARKLCVHCEEDHNNLCMMSYKSGVRYCNSIKLYGKCNGRKKKDERWIF